MANEQRSPVASRGTDEPGVDGGANRSPLVSNHARGYRSRGASIGALIGVELCLGLLGLNCLRLALEAAPLGIPGRSAAPMQMLFVCAVVALCLFAMMLHALSVELLPPAGQAVARSISRGAPVVAAATVFVPVFATSDFAALPHVLSGIQAGVPMSGGAALLGLVSGAPLGALAGTLFFLTRRGEEVRGEPMPKTLLVGIALPLAVLSALAVAYIAFAPPVSEWLGTASVTLPE